VDSRALAQESKDRAVAMHPVWVQMIGLAKRVYRRAKAQDFHLRRASRTRHTPLRTRCGRLAIALHCGINL